MVFYAGFGWFLFLMRLVSVALPVIFPVHKCLCVATEDHGKSYTKSHDIATFFVLCEKEHP